MRVVRLSILALAVALLLPCGAALAHFGMVIPSSSMVLKKEKATIVLALSFSHPMERKGMDMAAPKSFQAICDGKAENLTASLKPAVGMGAKAWMTAYTLKRPGVYAFVMEPAPYWEPAEDKFIIHYTKTYVAAFGEEEGWDKPVGLKTEIVPLTRPFGNYAGNVFRGVVLLDGKPVPGAMVEVELYNRDGKAQAPNEYMVTQVVKADDAGVFAFGVPFPGWWGFAALSDAPEKMDHNGTPKDVELGAVLWMEFVAPIRQ